MKLIILLSVPINLLAYHLSTLVDPGVGDDVSPPGYELLQDLDLETPLIRRPRKTKKNDTLWANAIVYYDLLPPFPHKGTIGAGIAHWEKHTCIRFVRTYNRTIPHLQFRRLRGCRSAVGVVGNRGQNVSIGRECEALGLVVHEIGHALGFYHEIRRPDRDQYVAVNSRNVAGRELFNFFKMESLDVNVAYDLSSVMHYTPLEWSHNGRTTVATRDPMLQGVIGMWKSGYDTGLSHRDKLLANRVYNCFERWLTDCNQTEDPCQNEGYIGANCSCICPPGTEGTFCQNRYGGYYDHLKSPCNREVTFDTIITTPNYPANYDQDTWCVYVLRSPEQCQSPVLQFLDFQLGPRDHIQTQECYYDYVEIRNETLYEGEIKCAHELKPGQFYYSNSTTMILYFKGIYGGYRGFKAKVNFRTLPNCCRTIEKNGDVTVETPDYPNSYSDHFRCNFRLPPRSRPWKMLVRSSRYNETTGVDPWSCTLSLCQPSNVCYKICRELRKPHGVWGEATSWLFLPNAGSTHEFAFNANESLFDNEDTAFKLHFTREESRCHKMLELNESNVEGRVEETARFFELLQCEWWIKSPEGTHVEVLVHEVELPALMDAYLAINEAGESSYPPETTRVYRNALVPSTFVSLKNSISIAFQADFSAHLAFTYRIYRCRDLHRDCEYWALVDECTHNSAWMTSNCKTSCQKCRYSVECEDNHSECEYWSWQGECDVNRSWMDLHCKKSCGVCERCRDANSQCFMWYLLKECERNKGYMNSFCPKTCGFCIPQTTTTTTTTTTPKPPDTSRNRYRPPIRNPSRPRSPRPRPPPIRPLPKLNKTKTRRPKIITTTTITDPSKVPTVTLVSTTPAPDVSTPRSKSPRPRLRPPPRKFSPTRRPGNNTRTFVSPVPDRGHKFANRSFIRTTQSSNDTFIPTRLETDEISPTGGTSIIVPSRVPFPLDLSNLTSLHDRKRLFKKRKLFLNSTTGDSGTKNISVTPLGLHSQDPNNKGSRNSFNLTEVPSIYIGRKKKKAPVLTTYDRRRNLWKTRLGLTPKINKGLRVPRNGTKVKDEKKELEERLKTVRGGDNEDDTKESGEDKGEEGEEREDVGEKEQEKEEEEKGEKNKKETEENEVVKEEKEEEEEEEEVEGEEEEEVEEEEEEEVEEEEEEQEMIVEDGEYEFEEEGDEEGGDDDVSTALEEIQTLETTTEISQLEKVRRVQDLIEEIKRSRHRLRHRRRRTRLRGRADKQTTTTTIPASTATTTSATTIPTFTTATASYPSRGNVTRTGTKNEVTSLEKQEEKRTEVIHNKEDTEDNEVITLERAHEHGETVNTSRRESRENETESGEIPDVAKNLSKPLDNVFKKSNKEPKSLRRFGFRNATQQELKKEWGGRPKSTRWKGENTLKVDNISHTKASELRNQTENETIGFKMSHGIGDNGITAYNATERSKLKRQGTVSQRRYRIQSQRRNQVLQRRREDKESRGAEDQDEGKLSSEKGNEDEDDDEGLVLKEGSGDQYLDEENDDEDFRVDIEGQDIRRMREKEDEDLYVRRRTSYTTTTEAPAVTDGGRVLGRHEGSPVVGQGPNRIRQRYGNSIRTTLRPRRGRGRGPDALREVAVKENRTQDGEIARGPQGSHYSNGKNIKGDDLSLKVAGPIWPGGRGQQWQDQGKGSTGDTESEEGEGHTILQEGLVTTTLTTTIPTTTIPTTATTTFTTTTTKVRTTTEETGAPRSWVLPENGDGVERGGGSVVGRRRKVGTRESKEGMRGPVRLKVSGGIRSPQGLKTSPAKGDPTNIGPQVGDYNEEVTEEVPKEKVGPKEVGLKWGEGPRGEKGPDGKVGPTGEPGPRGQMGPTGRLGPRGEVGPIGKLGPKGETDNKMKRGPNTPMGSRIYRGPEVNSSHIDRWNPLRNIGRRKKVGPKRYGSPNDVTSEGEPSSKEDLGDLDPKGQVSEIKLGPRRYMSPKGDKDSTGRLAPKGEASSNIGLKGEKGPKDNIDPDKPLRRREGSAIKVGLKVKRGRKVQRGPNGNRGPKRRRGPNGSREPNVKQGLTGRRGPIWGLGSGKKNYSTTTVGSQISPEEETGSTTETTLAKASPGKEEGITTYEEHPTSSFVPLGSLAPDGQLEPQTGVHTTPKVDLSVSRKGSIKGEPRGRGKGIRGKRGRGKGGGVRGQRREKGEAGGRPNKTADTQDPDLLEKETSTNTVDRSTEAPPEEQLSSREHNEPTGHSGPIAEALISSPGPVSTPAPRGVPWVFWISKILSGETSPKTSEEEVTKSKTDETTTENVTEDLSGPIDGEEEKTKVEESETITARPDSTVITTRPIPSKGDRPQAKVTSISKGKRRRISQIPQKLRYALGFPIMATSIRFTDLPKEKKIRLKILRNQRQLTGE